jgi:hypothetical protein
MTNQETAAMPTPTPSTPSTTPVGGNRIYRDFANLTEMDACDMWDRDYYSRSSCAKKDKNFPERLHYVLSEIEKDGLQHIAFWQPHGRCFMVRDQKLFTKDFLPNWFRQSKFPSFQRQLNIYNFTRITSGKCSAGSS